jgi:hypothetical protein
MAKAQGRKISITTSCEKLSQALYEHYAAEQPVSLLGVEFVVLANQIEVGVYDHTVTIHGETRPKAEWTGEGRPPVGTVCEALVYNCLGVKRWTKCQVIHRSNDSVAVAHGGNNQLICWAAEFRTIRTPEQIAEEASKAQIDGLARMMGASGNYERAAQHLYDCGVRLPEVKQ